MEHLRRPPLALSGAILVAVVVLDQWTKAWALRVLQGAPPRTVIPGFFDLTFGRNTGGVFGLFAGTPTGGRRLFFAAATAAALLVIAVLLRRWGRESRALALGLALVAGGAVGNLVDRLRFGSVVDFIDWYWRDHHWYTFNIADAAITGGSALILLHSLLPRRSPETGSPDRAEA
jgi:signal peptidase II